MKPLKIVCMVLLLAGIAFLVTVMILFSLGRINFGSFFRSEKQVEILKQTEPSSGINELYLDLSSTDVQIVPSDAEEITVTYKGPESKKNDPDVTIEKEDGKLKVIQEKMDILSWFSWNFTQRLIVIEVPASYIGDLDVMNKSGNLTIDGNYTFKSYHSDITSGDVSIDSMNTADFTMSNTSGNIKIGTLKADTFDIHVTSGDTKAEEITGNGTFKTTSGNITVLLLNGQADFTTASGDTTVKEWKGSGSMHCSSGNIEAVISESDGDMTIGTTSGNIRVELGQKAAYRIKASVISGDINSDLPLTYSGSDKNSANGETGTAPKDLLSIKATSGNIRIAA